MFIMLKNIVIENNEVDLTEYEIGSHFQDIFPNEELENK